MHQVTEFWNIKCLSQIYRKNYSDYLMPNRYGLFKKIIETALAKGYEHYSLIRFYELIKSGISIKKKIFVHRHDVDTDPAGARLFFEIEKSLRCEINLLFSPFNIRYKINERDSKLW